MYENRLKLVEYGILLFLGIVILRLFQIQVLNHAKYSAEARDQHWSATKVSARRGDIRTADGFSVATTTVIYNLFVETQKITNKEAFSKNIAKLVNELDEKSVNEAISKNGRWIQLSSNILPEERKAILDSDLINKSALHFEETYKRYYPEGRMLSHVLGFVGKDKNSNETGYYGLEQFYDGDLKGQDGLYLLEKSAFDNPIIWGGENKVEASDGSTLVLTIDRNIQYLAEKEIKYGVERYGAKSGTVVIVEPNTGAVLAMANYPNYNMSSPNLEDSEIRNSSIGVVYEPGSVMKAITMSVAVDMGLVTPDTTMMDSGPKWYSGHKVDNWDGKHHGLETMTSVLQHSNNIGISWVGLKVGGKNLMEYFDLFGFGRKLGIDLDGEESGLIYPPRNLKDIEIVNAAFGQGIAVTPLQMTMAFAAIANGGKLMKPYVVDKIISSDKETTMEPVILDKPLTRKTSDIMTKMLTDAVSGGEEKYFVSKKYAVAGKTGTAQVPIPGGYDEYRTNATFVGYLPKYKNFVMLIRLEEPTSPSGYSSETAVPLWMKIGEEIANYYGLEPDILNN